jgi:DNA-binding transcriptional ArsR family regulator
VRGLPWRPRCPGHGTGSGRAAAARRGRRSVAAHEGGEACVCELTERLGLTQPTISHHLEILVDAGIFTRDKRGVWAYYALFPAAMNALSAVLSTTSQHLNRNRSTYERLLPSRWTTPVVRRQAWNIGPERGHQ